jgi:hypothetical protein
MDLKERLNQLTSLTQKEEKSKSQVLSELRQRLDRVFEPKKVYRKRESVPIEQLVKGEIVRPRTARHFRQRSAIC